MERARFGLVSLSLVAGLACSVSAFEPPATPAPATEKPKTAPATIVQPAGGDAAKPATEGDAVDMAVNAFKAKRAELMKERKTDRASFQKAAEEALGGLKVDQLNAAQLRKLADSGLATMANKEFSDAFNDRAAALSKEPTAEGARAALLRLSMAGRTPPDKQTEAAKSALSHPKLGEIMSEPGTLRALATLDNLNDAALKPIVNDVVGLAKSLPETVTPADAFALRAIVQSIADASTPKEREPLRVKALTSVQASLNKMSEGDKDRERVESVVKALDGAYIKTGLVGYPAPDLDITWSSTENKIAHLSDLKGKVVVVDFWATWCGPCRASFPNVKKLQAYYKDSPVVILGVTSLQGSHTDPKAATKEEQRIDCKGDAEKEYSLMPGFMKNWEMTWPVVFSKQNVFNPEYGVNGIPHVVIIDAKGVVRYRGLHPGSGLPEKIQHINDLLKEANLPVPAPYVEEPKGDKGEGNSKN